MRQGIPKMAHPATKVIPDEPKWAQFGRTFGHLGRSHFYEVFVSNCAFFLKINETPRKIRQIDLKFMNIAQKHGKDH